MLRGGLLDRLDLAKAVREELESSTRLLPPRLDYLALTPNAAKVETLIRSAISRNAKASLASVVFADKPGAGTRPLNVMHLQDRILYRAITNVLADALPPRFSARPAFGDFVREPLGNADTKYISKTDINSYYVYVDHDLLGDELIAQTGDEHAVAALTNLLEQVMGRRFGLPQVHKASDILGDTYIDPVRRRLRRAGYDVFTYSDDFRIGSQSLGAARLALEECAAEARVLGLVLNERKTFTYGRDKYVESLDSFSAAERRLLQDEGPLLDVNLFLLADGYDDDVESDVSSEPILEGLDETESGFDDEGHPEPTAGVSISGDPELEQRARIARRVWHLWGDKASPDYNAPIMLDLLEKTLPVLGTAGERGPLHELSQLLRSAPGLTPQIASYLNQYAATGIEARSDVREALSDISDEDTLSVWQKMWLADVGGRIRRTSEPARYVEWLTRCVETGPDALAATAGAALGRLGYGDPEVLAQALNRVGGEWSPMIVWGLGQLNRDRAKDLSDKELDRLLFSMEET